MRVITYENVHNRFKLNGYKMNRFDLCIIANSLIKEGAEFEIAAGKFILDWFDSKTHINLKTSGTTSEPKIIQISKQAMVNSALATGDFFELKPGDKALLCLSTNYIAGKMMLVRSIILGLEIDVISPSSFPLLNNNKWYDFVAMVPLQVQNSISELKNVNKIIVGGAKMNKSLENKLSDVSSKVYETYGMTETITHIAAKKVGEEAFSLLPNIQISQNDKNCLVINAPNISLEPIITNDLVEIINDNQFLFLGRIDNLVNSGGVKLIPEQIEEKLSTKIQSRFFVAGIPDDELGEKLVLIIEGENDTLEKTVFEVLDKYEKPKEVFFVSKFIETENGKIKRKEVLASIL
ncbi:AMP-binding protein [Flavobacterium sp. K5-23]|uniref:AMP-binding protein n=1 Tax=Flavobacterium sp. K5-23 TaxID=2746225 RepID=UPI00200CAAC8|nr:AMP-binding protein [Flavobacterium sp. K5-23]UQD57322.1 AMP-binding protein [Flavobacterium sp. K5-23]